LANRSLPAALSAFIIAGEALHRYRPTLMNVALPSQAAPITSSERIVFLDVLRAFSESVPGGSGFSRGWRSTSPR
jgi:hypothetical protein